jgi:DNA-binding transcriptional ArsR family regulator
MSILEADKPTQKRIFQMQCEICKSLAHPIRLQIVDRLNRGEASASELLETLGISKGNLSKHMSLLLNSGIVVSLRKGRHIFYRLTDPEIHKACSIMRTILYNRLKRGGKLASAIKQTEANN